jgi:hypothetical protein
VLLLWLACTPTAPPKAASPLDSAWLGQLMTQPQLFTQTVDSEREAWVALHANSWRGAHRDSASPARRASDQHADLASRVAGLEAMGWERTLSAWTPLPAGSALPFFAGLSALESGGDHAKWWTMIDAEADPVVLQATQKMLEYPTLGTRLPDTLGNPLLERIDQHLAARLGASEEWPSGMAWTEPMSNGETRRFPDPQLPWTLSVVLDSTEKTTGMDALLFSDCLSTSVCGPDVIAALGVDPALGVSDNPNVVRSITQSLDEVLDTWAQDQRKNASPEALGLLAELQLVQKFRGQLLLSLADEALNQGHPKQAVVLVQSALDLNGPRTLGPVNSPTLFAVLAQAHLESGHTREALDALEVLARSYPEAVGADEILGDLAILEGLDRQGDSKEN